MSTAVQRACYPAAIEQKLRHIRRRQCTLAVVRALLLTAAVLLAAMLLAMLADWSLTLFSTAARTALTAAAIVAALVTLLWTGVFPLAASRGLRQAASKVDQALPHLEQRWTTVASFAEMGRRPRAAIPAAMLQQVTSEAVALARLVEPARVAAPAPARRAAAWLACAAAAVVAFLAIDWPHHRVLLARFWFPLSKITATQVESLTGDLVVPRGEPVRLSIRTSGLHRTTASLELAAEGVDIETFQLADGGDSPDQFTYDIPSLQSSLKYRVQAGDGRTRWHTVTAIDRPFLAEVKVTLTPPAYVDRPVYEKDYLPDRLQAVQGSHLRLQFHPKAALKRFALTITPPVNRAGDDEPTREVAPPQTLHMTPDSDGWYRYQTVLETDVTIQPELLSPHGLAPDDAQQCRIRVIADRAPVARIISPTEEMAVEPGQVVDIRFEAHDDHGIAKAELVVYEEPPDAGDPPTILSVEEIPLGQRVNSPHVAATAKLDLSKHALSAGSNISFAIRVTDNRAEAPEKATRTLTETESLPLDEAVVKDESSSRPLDSSDSPAPATAEASTIKAQDADYGQDITRVELAAPANPQLPAPIAVVPASELARASAPSPASTLAEQARETNKAGANSQNDASAYPSPSKSDQIPATVQAPVEPANAPPPGDDAPPAVSLTKDLPTKNRPADSDVAVADDKSRQPAEKPGNAPPPAPLETLTRDSTTAPREPQPMRSGDSAAQHRHPDFLDDLRGQLTESSRLRLKIEEKLTSAPAPGVALETMQIKVRGRLEEIDRELAPAEQALSSLVDAASQSGIADPQLQVLSGVDGRLAKVDRLIADLRSESKETPLAFAGLHMVEIAAAHIAPARDRVFALTRQPDADARGNSAAALHHVKRARELLAELLIRYERLRREQNLAGAIDQTAKIYEVYVKNLHRFLRAQSKPNANPLQRKMAIVEVDQDYLDRLRQVTEMRRDLMAEFARMLADDPRLLSKYMDLIKRRQTSLRDRLTDLHQRQETIATELSGWLRVDPQQRDDLWLLAAEVRLQELAPLAQEASQLAERTTSQLPLGIDSGHTIAADVVEGAKQVAVRARSAAAKARRLLQDPFDDSIDLTSDIDQMSLLMVELDAAFERLAFEKPEEEIVDFTNKRLAESRALAERIAGWSEMALHLQARQFPGVAKVDQHQLALRTELLRIDVAAIDQQLATQFRDGVPESVTTLAGELKQLMESVTFNQQAATFELEAERLAAAQAQQALALNGFQRAEELFDRIRRQVIEEADKINPDNPNIADLVDPTLDEILARLEREPNLNALLGIPNRPRNLRMISDFFASADGEVPVPSALEQAAEQARQRARQEQDQARRMRQQTETEPDKSEEQWREIASAEEAQEKLEARIEELRRQAQEATDEDQAARLRQLAEQLERMRQQLGSRPIDDKDWREMVRSDQMKAILKAAAAGEPLPDTQWNRLMSSLDDGLWQVRRRSPPEEYRQAIEQYQERIRKLLSVEATDETP